MTAALALRSVSVRLGTVTALDGVDLEVAEGETLALLGPSGSGKTTLLRVLLGFAAPSSGEVWIAGRAAAGVPPEERELAVVFQDLALWPHMTVRAHLAFALRARRLSRGERDTRIAETLERLALPALAERRPAELSGGERQRVAIARALVARPRAILLDEPLANVDVALAAELLALFRSVLRGQRVTTIYVTHDPREAAALADRIAVLEGGRVTQIGTLDEIRSEPATSFARLAFGS
jgi:ABC-type sugar transport system ATPase subunit